MAEIKTNPWIVGGLILGAVSVFYVLYAEYRSALAAKTNSDAQNTTATGATAIVNSLIPDQIPNSYPSYPDTARVTDAGTVVGTSTAVATGRPPVQSIPPNTGATALNLPAVTI